MAVDHGQAIYELQGFEKIAKRVLDHPTTEMTITDIKQATSKITAAKKTEALISQMVASMDKLPKGSPA